VEDRILAQQRERLARETGTVRKDWGGRLSVALAYPNTYRLAMSNLGFQVVYDLLNRNEHVVAERVFFPDEPESSLPSERGRGLLSLESLSPLVRFDLVAFCLPFENDAPHILRMLAWGRIPPLQSARGEDDPLILGGGITTFLNPEPLAIFFDAFLLGEAEAVLGPFLSACRQLVGKGVPRAETLHALAREVPGLYVPSLYRPVYRSNGLLESTKPLVPDVPERIRVIRDPANHPPAVSSVTTPETEFGEKVLVELGRGCGRSCRFCAAGYVYRPPRVRREADLVDAVDRALGVTDRLGLLSAAVSDTPGIHELTDRILAKGGTFSVSSLRADSLTSKLLENLKRSGQKRVAIAPEAGTDRLRRVINKHLTEEQIVEAVRLIASVEDFSLRLYFLIGLPTETREDVEGISDLVKRLKHHIVQVSRGRGTIGRIRLSVNCFVPKAFTPFQWFPMDSVASLKEKQKSIRRELRREGGVDVTFDVPKWAYLQSLLSRGDRRVGGMLHRAYELDGNWKKTFLQSEVNPDFFVYRPRELDETLPWDHIDTGIRKTHLMEEYRLALEERESPECRVGRCERCGVCSLVQPPDRDP
jgi:radical SAM superfamily enzyme YgiQ (UPF0313 family)